jgi:hypothetical protein
MSKFERKFLLDALEIDEWRILLEVHGKGQAEHTRAVNVIKPLLQNYLGWTEESSSLILDCYTTAMGWNDVTVPQTRSKPKPQSSTNTAVIDDETRELLEFVKQLKKNSDGQILQPQPPPVQRIAKPSVTAAPAIGSTLKFGRYDWRVLDVQGGKALIITKDVTRVNMPYNKTFAEVTWETCTLRKWLNEDFPRTFSGQEQARIALTANINENNQRYGTAGGNNTQDRLFLLSISEVVKYFGDSGQLKKRPSEDSYWIDDKYNSARAAKYNGFSAWWWLRSPGDTSSTAAYVSTGGDLDVSGRGVSNGLASGGVRPALWLNL